MTRFDHLIDITADARAALAPRRPVAAAVDGNGAIVYPH